MKREKTVWILSFLGILLMLFFIIFGNGLVAESCRLSGKFSMEKVLVSVKNHKNPHGANSFSVDDISRLQRELSTEAISYIAQSGLISTSVSKDGISIPVSLTGIDSMYPMFHGFFLWEGSFITKQHEDEGARVTVVDAELAWDLFKTEGATGKNIEIFGDVFTIIGVVIKDNSLIGKLTDDGLSKVYIPTKVMLEIDTTSSITALQIKTTKDGRLDENFIEVSNALRQIGKDPRNYHIIDFNLKYQLLKQWPLLFVFIIGIKLILILLIHIKNVVKRLYFLIRNGCKTDYFSNVVKLNRRIILIYTLKMGLVFLGIILIWMGISFYPYIPSNYIPDELINISYYSDLIKNMIQGGIQNMGYVPPQAQLIVNTINSFMHLSFWSSVVLGFLFMYSAFREFKRLNLDSSSIILRLSILYLISLGIIAILALLIGVPFILEIKGLLMVWSFIFINILSITMRKESDIYVEENH